MEDTCRMYVFQSSKNLVQEKLYMIIRKRLIRLDDLSQVSFHKLTDHVDFFEFLSGFRFKDGLDTNNIVML